MIATSNLTGTTENAFDYVLNFSSLIDKDAEVIDHSLIMLLKTLINIGCTKATLAGFDGYSSSTSNYFDVNMEYDSVKRIASYLNNYTNQFLKETQNKLEVQFLTESWYVQ